MAICGDAYVAGAANHSPRCEAEATHTLRRKRLCETHWRMALNHRDREAARGQAYARALDSYRRL